MEKGEPSYTVGGIQVGAATLENSVEIRFLKKLKIELPYDPAIAILGIYPKDTDVVKRKAIGTPMLIAAIATFYQMWKEPTCPSTDEWIKKIWSIYTMEYYASIRNDEYSTFVSTWTGLEEIMLSKISQAERADYHTVSLVEHKGGH